MAAKAASWLEHEGKTYNTVSLSLSLMSSIPQTETLSWFICKVTGLISMSTSQLQSSTSRSRERGSLMLSVWADTEATALIWSVFTGPRWHALQFGLGSDFCLLIFVCAIHWHLSYCRCKYHLLSCSSACLSSSHCSLRTGGRAVHANPYSMTPSHQTNAFLPQCQ